MTPINTYLIRKLLGCALTVALALPASAAEFYVSPAGASTGDGSTAQPWNLETALTHPSSVKPGDTIWLRDGEYLTTAGFTATLAGATNAPITVRSYPGERAILVGNQTSGSGLRIIGAWVNYWDLELKSSLTVRPSTSGGLGFHGHHNKLINCVVHDTGNNAPHGNGNLIYGSLFYYNGTDGSGLGHAMYIQNEDPNQPASFEENIIFASYAFGVHAYAGGVGLLKGLHFIGNVAFLNGAAQATGELKDNYLVGGVNGQQGVSFRENMGWSYSPNTRSVALGRYSDIGNVDITLSNNYFVGTTLFYNQWQSITMTGNTFYGPVTWEGSNLAAEYPSNSYLATRPVQNKIFVRPNRYEPGRANIIVYNWESSDSAAVDLNGALAPNSYYEVRNAQNYFGPAVLTGFYTGGSLTLPLTGLNPALPISGGLLEESEKTGKNFNVFILRQTATPGTQIPAAPRNLMIN